MKLRKVSDPLTPLWELLERFLPLEFVLILVYLKLIYSGLSFGVIVVSAVMIWNVLRLALWTESPVVVVLSGSMEPSMYRGDILFLQKQTPIENGDIIVYQVADDSGIPIVHRVMTV